MARGQENEKGKVAVAAFSFVVLSEYVVSLFQCYLDGFGVFSFQQFGNLIVAAPQHPRILQTSNEHAFQGEPFVPDSPITGNLLSPFGMQQRLHKLLRPLGGVAFLICRQHREPILCQQQFQMFGWGKEIQLLHLRRPTRGAC